MEGSPMTPPAGGTGPSGPRAGFWRRFGAYLLDSILIGIVVGILTAALKTPGYFVGIAIGLAYFVYFEGGSSGQTIGKRVLDIRVIDYATGGPLGYGKAFLRWIGRIVSGAICALGYLWMIWDKEKQTWHDKIAGTVVVPVSDYPVNRT
jgi:uncharacterized RDD family membrane protein YckC